MTFKSLKFMRDDQNSAHCDMICCFNPLNPSDAVTVPHLSNTQACLKYPYQISPISDHHCDILICRDLQVSWLTVTPWWCFEDAQENFCRCLQFSTSANNCLSALFTLYIFHVVQDRICLHENLLPVDPAVKSTPSDVTTSMLLPLAGAGGIWGGASGVPVKQKKC